MWQQVQGRPNSSHYWAWYCYQSSGQSPFRVLGIYDKYYNKWYLGKEPWKAWPRNDKDKDERKYKLDICMLDKDALDECADVPLYHADFKKKDVYKTIEDSQILSIEG